MKKYTLFLLCFFLSAYILEAQGRIDKVIDYLEGRPDVETTYTERRSPKKKKLIMTSRIFNFESSDYFDKLRRAFEDERSNSISAVKTKNQMTYRFDNEKGVSTYTLSWSGDRGPFTMVMTWRSSEAGDSSMLPDAAGMLDFGAGEFTMGVDELQRRLNCSNSSDSDDEVIIISNGKIVKVSSENDGDMGSAINTFDSFGCPVNVVSNSRSYSSSTQKREESEKARRKAVKEREKKKRELAEARAKVRKEAAEARQAAAKARQEAAKLRAQAQRKAAKARAEARRSAAKARRAASVSRRTSSSSNNSEAIYELAARSRCRIISSGTVVETSALDALDNADVWKALEFAAATASGRSQVTTTTNSGSKTTVIIEPEPERI